MSQDLSDSINSYSRSDRISVYSESAAPLWASVIFFSVISDCKTLRRPSMLLADFEHICLGYGEERPLPREDCSEPFSRISFCHCPEKLLALHPKSSFDLTSKVSELVCWMANIYLLKWGMVWIFYVHLQNADYLCRWTQNWGFDKCQHKLFNWACSSILALAYGV